MNNMTVSFDNEMLILVDQNDQVLGYKSKADCHLGDGILHRAFSIFIFNSDGEMLLQQRGQDKLLWPGFWSNSCCSHPRQGEDYDTAVLRRLREELGLVAELRFLYQFQYQARYENRGAEHELCSVYVGFSDAPVLANPTEIAAWKFMSQAALDVDMAARAELYTPWFKMEWRHIQTHFAGMITDGVACYKSSSNPS